MNTLTPTVPPARFNVWFALRRMVSGANIYVGGLIVGLVIVMAVFAPWIAPYDPAASDWLAIRQEPSWAHWMGTDDLGRDTLSRIIFGARASLSAGVISVLFAMVVGVPLGLISGYFGGWIDAAMARVTEAMLTCPFLVLAIALAAFLGPGLQNAMIAIGISASPLFIRLARGQAMVVKQEDYVDATRALGASSWRIIVRHILPNSMPPLIVQGTLTIATSILAESSLAFLGLGQLPPAPSWGSMLDAARQFLSESSEMAVFPGLAIILTVAGFNLLGDGLRRRLDRR
ncbi:diguanylate cyclase [Devosia riboflavina]|uniref:Diguanylate cyclase n=1 Tax=Devosia riboflavina TaxID=46914 RepID=A0A087M2R4_9HYPH|nr:ABC transporter permease [Devosia riboflavina]KFL31167.1 diguanylate cyclase [Devosia riboflavina]